MNRKEFLLITVATLITVVAWVVFDIIHKRADVKLPANVQNVIEPINPDFNLNNIK
ncbi:hypothetical protein HYS92_03175 [Candidatus Daviesbacteria bacterium]|nr:hypothetical protein [Candidatus Daviesbacteria bacterium]